MHTTIRWQQILKQAYRSLPQLLDTLGLTAEQCQLAKKDIKHFPLLAPQSYVNRMRYGDPKDPLLLQILPHEEEEKIMPGFSQDPLQEKQANHIPGLIHKYHGRVLILLNGSCAIHCRYCFRQFFPYQQQTLSWPTIKNYLMAHTEIEEIIFSGGDPLLQPDQTISTWINHIETIPHITTIRWHTRIPIVLPERIDKACAQNMRFRPGKTIVVLHTNHPNELNDMVQQACTQLSDQGILLLNQSVLLKHINDDASIQIALQKKLFIMGIMPYYLHLLDPVQGSKRYRISLKKAQMIHQAMQAQLPGYCVPKLVKEVAQHKSKIWKNN